MGPIRSGTSGTRPRAVASLLVGSGITVAAYLLAGLLRSARPIALVPLLAAAAVGALLPAQVHLVARFRASERTGGPRPARYVQGLLYAVVLAETGAAYLLGHAAFWAWFAALALSWLVYREFFAPGLLDRRPALARYAALLLHALLVLVGFLARAG